MSALIEQIGKAVEAAAESRESEFFLEQMGELPWQAVFVQSAGSLAQRISVVVAFTKKSSATYTDTYFTKGFSVDSIGYVPSDSLARRIRSAIFDTIESIGCYQPKEDLGEGWTATDVCPISPKRNQS